MSEDLSLGQILDMRIDGEGAAGEGIGHPGGRAVFVPYTARGELVRVRLVHLGRKRVVAQLEEVLEASPSRVEPPCPVFGRCGGCQLMHLDYQAQLKLKARLLGDTLRTVAGLEWSNPIPVAAAPEPLGGRNRGQYPVALQGRKVVTGFFAPRSHEVVAQTRCPIHHPDLDRAVALVRSWAGRKKIPIYDEGTGQGWLRHVVVRRSAASGKVLLTLVGTTPRTRAVPDLIRSLRTRLSVVSGLCLNINPHQTNVILGSETRRLWGQGHVDEKLGQLSFRLSSGSFFQVNSAQAEVLFGKVVDFLGDLSGPVVDAYCGVGVLAQLLKTQQGKVVAIELAPSAVSDGRAAAQSNGVLVDFHQGRVEQVLPRLVERGLAPAAVVLDPPRKGCDRLVMDAVVKSGCQRIAYVSCHPGTLARDLTSLFAAGFRLDRLEAVDMFPQTAHLETFAGLSRK